ncbi:MAG: DUF1015 family protein [Cytophagales bacterium]|nr:DUF1015 family protein [Cytophagales bacterium]
MQQQLLNHWKDEGTSSLQDKLPAIYVYYQYFKLAGSSKDYCRKGFISSYHEPYDWEEKVILRHENTIPRSVNRPGRITRVQTELHVSPTHGLYTDPTFTLEKYMDEVIYKSAYMKVKIIRV